MQVNLQLDTVFLNQCSLGKLQFLCFLINDRPVVEENPHISTEESNIV